MTDSSTPIHIDGPASAFQSISASPLATAMQQSPLHIYQQIVDRAEDGIWLVDQQWKTIYVNPRLGELLGWPPAAMLGRPITDFMDDEARQVATSLMQRRQAGVRESHEFRFTRCDGSDLWVFIATHPIQDASGAFVGAVAMLSDITMRKRMEVALREHEANLQAVLESSADDIWAVDRDYRLILANTTFVAHCERVFGRHLHPGDCVIDDLIPPAARAEWQGYYDRALAGEHFSVEVTSQLTSEPRILDYRFYPMCDATGAITGVAMSGRDITDRKRNEEMLRQREAALNEAMDIARIGVYMWDLRSDALQWSPQMYDLLDLSADTMPETLSAAVASLLHPNDRDWVSGEINAMLMQRRTWPLEYRLQRPDGKTIWVRAGSRFEFDEAGAPVRIIGVHHDITESKRTTARMEARLRMTAYATDHALHALLQQMLNEAEALTESTIGFFHFVDADQQSLSLQTWSTNTIQNVCAAEGAGLHYPIDDAGLWVECIRQKRPLIVNNIMHADGRKGWPSGHAPVTRMMTTPIIRNGLVVGVMGVGNRAIDYEDTDLDTLTLLADSFWEIVQAKRAEEALLAAHTALEQRVEERTVELRAANAELAQALRVKDEFLANMSHELRTPLNAIITLAEVLKEQIHGPLNTRQARSAELIGESGRHLLDLINAVLDLSRMEAGIFEVDVDPVDANSICELSLRFVWETALKKRQHLDFAPAQPPIILRADSRRLKQMLVNLLANAVKFTPEGGVVRLEVQPDLTQRTVRFIVTDNGIGIPAAAHADIFQPFFQVDSGLSRHYEGAGLGLALVKRLAELHGGSVTVASTGTPGQGSCFVVTLPWAGTYATQTDSDSHQQAAVTA